MKIKLNFMPLMSDFDKKDFEQFIEELERNANLGIDQPQIKESEIEKNAFYFDAPSDLCVLLQLIFMKYEKANTVFLIGVKKDNLVTKDFGSIIHFLQFLLGRFKDDKELPIYYQLFDDYEEANDVAGMIQTEYNSDINSNPNLN